MAVSDFSPESLAAAAGVDPWLLARRLTSGRPGDVEAVGRAFENRGLEAAEAARLGRIADGTTSAAFTNDAIGVYDAEASAVATRAFLSSNGESMREVGRLFVQLSAALAEAAGAANAAIATMETAINGVIERRNALVAGPMTPADREAADRGFVAEAVGHVRGAGGRVQAQIDDYDGVVRSRTAYLGELGYTVPEGAGTADEGGGFLNGLVGAGQDLVNGAISFGNAALQSPHLLAGMVTGGAIAALGAAGVASGAVATTTGVGSPVGVPLTALSSSAIATGVGMASVSGMALVDNAMGPDSVDLFATDTAAGSEPMEHWREAYCGDPLTPDAIHLPPSREAHILGGDETGGGHAPGVGAPGESEFPPGWQDPAIRERVLDVASNPDSTPYRNENTGNWVTRGERDGVEIEVIVAPDGRVISGYPEWGPGVVRNDRDGVPHSIEDPIAAREMTERLKGGAR